MSKLDELQAQVTALQAQLATLTGQTQPKRAIPLEERPDYVPHGSDRHATLLGLKKDEQDEWILADPLEWILRYGPAATPEFLSLVRQQRINELTSKPQVPADALPLWTPPLGQPALGMVF